MTLRAERDEQNKGNGNPFLSIKEAALSCRISPGHTELYLPTITQPCLWSLKEHLVPTGLCRWPQMEGKYSGEGEGWERERKQKEMENSASSIIALVGTGTAVKKGSRMQRGSGRREFFLLDFHMPKAGSFCGCKTACL